MRRATRRPLGKRPRASRVYSCESDTARKRPSAAAATAPRPRGKDRSMATRRRFLTALATSAPMLPALADHALARTAGAVRGVAEVPPDTLASHEDFWREVQLGFTLDR